VLTKMGTRGERALGERGALLGVKITKINKTKRGVKGERAGGKSKQKGVTKPHPDRGERNCLSDRQLERGSKLVGKSGRTVRRKTSLNIISCNKSKTAVMESSKRTQRFVGT